MTLIGLTGGIASGKSLVAHRFRELGATLVDADVVAREVVEPGTAALEQIVQSFGNEIVLPDGSLDRPRLGSVVFGNPEQLEILNKIVHPAVAKRTAELFSAAYARDPDGVVVYDIPLLVEARRDRTVEFDVIVVVHADEETRVDRMMANRGMTASDAWKRIRAQATDAQRLAVADYVLDNTGTTENTIAQVDALWESIRKSSGVGGAT